jgi:formamidopyrimidine-DNA glycosylase
MPELPEVETVARALRGFLPGRSFARIATFVPRLRLPLDLAGHAELLHVPVAEIRRRGRYLLLCLANGEGLLVHLGMTGIFRTAPRQAPRDKHDHAVFQLDDGSTLRFNDPRRFGFIVRCPVPPPGEDPPLLAGLGPEPLGAAFDGAGLHREFRGRTAPVKPLLMDNRIVVGVGNIYATEVLFRSRIHPLFPAGRLSRQQCDRLAESVKVILAEAIAAGGTTLVDFSAPDGTEGKFSRELQVYGRAGERCGGCRRGIIRRIVTAGRSAFFCPVCQPDRRGKQEQREHPHRLDIDQPPATLRRG